MPLLLQKTQLAAKLEAVEGTAENPLAGDALLVINPAFVPQVEMHERKIVEGDLSTYKSLSGRRSAKLSFEVELKGSGSPGVAPEWGKLLRACGFDEDIVPSTSVTYAPASTAIPSVTLALYLDGLLAKLWGARGTVKLSFTAGKPGSLGLEFTGADFEVLDAAMLSGMSYETTEPEKFLEANFSVDSYAAKIEKLEMDIANSLQLRSDVNRPSGYISALITGRRPGGSLDPELTLVADYDWYAKWRNGTEGSLSTSLGVTAGNIITITAPRCRYTKLGSADRGGWRILGADFELNRNAGDDELSIELT
jgi:hypothetical protein